MNRGEEVFRAVQARARASVAGGKTAPTQEYLTRHLLESFLFRLSRTQHAENFVLKGGVLLAAYGARRPTRDIDANAVRADITAAHLRRIVGELAQVDADDGVDFDLESITVQEIRENADYAGLRVRVAAAVGHWTGISVWDVSTGDPIVPAPRMVTIDRILGEPIKLLGYAAETAIVEKGVTILERGVSSTRWRDYVDIVQLCRQGFDVMELRRAAEAVARYRGVLLEPVSSHLDGYEEFGQVKWAAWRRKEGLEEISEARLDDQVALIAAYLDPIFAGGAG